MAQPFHAPATQRLYDVCILGSQLGGLVAGALLARRGFRVLHVAHGDVGVRYVDHGYALPRGPALLPSTRHLPAADAVLAELGLVTDLSRALQPSTPDLQLLLPRHRVELSREPAMLRGELRREWPREAAALDSALGVLGASFDSAGHFLRAAPPLPADGFFDRRVVRKAIKAAAEVPGAPSRRVGEALPFEGVEDHDLVRALGAVHRFLTYLDGAPSPLSSVRLLGGALRGTGRLPDGLGTLREMVRRKIAESRGELRGGPGEPVFATTLELERGRVAAVRLADSPDAHAARAFVVATDASHLLPLLPPDVRASKAGALLRRHRAGRRLLSVNFVVRRAALPPALGESALAMRAAGGGDGLDNAVLLQIAPAFPEAKRGTAGRAEEPAAEERVICASGFVDAVDDPEGMRSAAARIRAAVADAIPFFERHLVAESMPGQAAPSRAGSPPFHPLIAAEHVDRLGVGGLPVRSPWKNLFFAGREVVPGLGVEGEFHAGIQAAGHVAAALGRKDSLRRS